MAILLLFIFLAGFVTILAPCIWPLLPVDNSIAGADVKDSRLTLDEERLYSLIDLRGKVESHLLRLEFDGDGISVYAFTFG